MPGLHLASFACFVGALSQRPAAGGAYTCNTGLHEVMKNIEANLVLMWKMMGTKI
jgi:hypothetical protein